MSDFRVPASVLGIPLAGAYNHHPHANGRNLVTRLRGSPSPEQKLAHDAYARLILEQYGPQAAFNKYYSLAKAMSTQKKVMKFLEKVGAEIPKKPELHKPSRPRYQGRKAGKTSINKVLHKYPELLPLFFKPNVTFSPIVTAYLENRQEPGYPFFPDASGRYPNRTRRRGGSRSSSSRSSSASNGRSRSPSAYRSPRSPRQANKKPDRAGTIVHTYKTPELNSNSDAMYNNNNNNKGTRKRRRIAIVR